jgi:DNA polymerase
MSKHAIKETIDWLSEIGVDEIISPQPICKFEKAPDGHPSVEPVTQKSAVDEKVKEIRQPEMDHIQTLDDLQEYMKRFDRCELKNTATNMVFSDGTPKATVMIIGEAPGADEDRLGKPFVGMSGKLLDKALLSVGLSREKNVYISNIIPWRPPGNRPPTQDEIDTCLPLIQKHIQLISPALILCVGSVAAKSLLASKLAISKLRGGMHSYQVSDKQIPLLATYHPAFLLRSPYRKKDVWSDLLMARQKLTNLGLES